MAGVSTAVPVKHINDITECAICNEVFTDPRVLPCVHTFCFECITKWAEDQTKGDKLACPLCRKEFLISISTATSGTERVTDLPKNFFVQKVVNARKLSSALSRTDLHCDVCYEGSDGSIGEETGATAEKAVAYCVECSQNVCKQCCMYHQKMKTLREHRLVDLHENQLSHSEMPLLELPEDKCGKHGDKALMLYCHDCKVPTCPMCLATHHKQHNFADIKELADEMRVQMKADIASIASKVDECRQLLDKLDNSNSEFCRKIEDTATLVTDTAEKMKQAIDDYKAQLLDELESAKKQHEKKVESVCQELEAMVLMLEIFKHYSEQLRSKGTSCDVTASVAYLHNRTKELTALKMCDDFPDKCLLDVKFTSEFSADELHRLFGQLCIEDVQLSATHDTTSVGTGFEFASDHF